METPCTQAGLKEQGAAEGLHHPRLTRGLGGKKAKVVFQSKPLLGLVLNH